MNTTPFTQALTLDMARIDLNERQLGHRLGVTQQAVGKWLKQGFPPRRRVADLVEIFGEHSAVAALTPVQMYQVPGEKHGATPVASATPRPEQDLVAATATRKLQAHGLRDFTTALPPALRGYVNVGLTLHGADRTRTIVMDYASEKLLLEVVVRAHGAPLATVAPAAMRLLTASRIARAPRTVLVLLSNMPSEDAKRGESVAMSEALGVEVWVCPSGPDLAARVCEAEGVDLETQDDDLE